MNNRCKKLVRKLIEEISIANHPDTLDDNYADMIGESWQESINELKDYLDEV